MWCSDPVQGKAVTPKQFAHLAVSKMRETPPETSLKVLLTLLEKIKAFGMADEGGKESERDEKSGLSLVADSMTIIRVDE